MQLSQDNHFYDDVKEAIAEFKWRHEARRHIQFNHSLAVECLFDYQIEENKTTEWFTEKTIRVTKHLKEALAYIDRYYNQKELNKCKK